MLHLMSFSPSNFGRYVSQTEHTVDETTDNNEKIQIQQKSTINNIPSLMSLNITPPSNVTTNIQPKPLTPQPSVVKENIEPLPFPQHGPGPIQRPNKLPMLSNIQLSSFIQDANRSPDTPEVLVQINHLVDRQNSIASIPSNTSTLNNDTSTPHVSWTPFSPLEWSAKYDSTWPLTNIQSPNISSRQNPFAQRQISKDTSTAWPDASINTSWFKFSSVPDSTPSTNTQENETNDPFWNPMNPSRSQGNSSAAWWPKTPSDENNNDQSRWEFAR